VVTKPAGFLLDTNVISELMKRRPNRRVAEWVDVTSEELLHLSVITIGEIRRGIDLLDDDDPRRVALQTWLDHDLRVRFAGRFLAFDDAVAERWARGAGEEAAVDASHYRRAACRDRTASRPDVRYQERQRHPADRSAGLQSVE